MPAPLLAGLLRRPGPVAATDAALLGRFVADRDEAAFAGLVRRHGPMVLGVCRRALGPGADADDAFQAVWLVLVRKPTAVRPRGRVGAWLYGVAVRTAAHARAARRRTLTRELPDVPDPRPRDPDSADLAAVIDAELAALPEAYRAAVVLCELEGRSLKDAAADLGVPVGTLASRLARGRKRLADRLARQGLGVPAAGLTGWFASQATARVPGALFAAAGGSAGEAAGPVASLTDGVLKMMLADKLKALARAAVAVGLVAVGGAGLLAPAVGRPDDPPKERRLATPGYVKPATDLEREWSDLGHSDEDRADLALLRLSRRPPAELLAHIKKMLKPVALTKAEADKLLADALGDDKPARDAALRKLLYFNPRLVYDVDALWAKTTDEESKRRMGAVLLGGTIQNWEWKAVSLRRWEHTDRNPPSVDYGLNLVWDPIAPVAVIEAEEGRGRRTSTTISIDGNLYEVGRHSPWKGVVRAITLLENLGTPEAVAVIKDMATGHPDARPTIQAKRALERLAAKK